MSIGSYGNEQEDSQEYESEVEMQCDSHGMVVLGMGFNIYAHLSSSSTLDNKVCVFPIAHSQSTVMSTGSSGKEQEESQECEYHGSILHLIQMRNFTLNFIFRLLSTLVNDDSEQRPHETSLVSTSFQPTEHAGDRNSKTARNNW